MKRTPLIKMVIILLLVSSCATRQTFETADVDNNEMISYLADKPVQLHSYFKQLRIEMDRNSTLNHMRIGYKAFETKHMNIARSSFEIVRNDLSAIYANNAIAQKARTLWYEEGMKKFRGEPYERAMAYYYSGLIFMIDGDYENARACFKSGILQDAFAEESQYQCDFGLLVFLEALSSKALGDEYLFKDALKRLIEIRPDFNQNFDINTLVLVETGYAPRKLADGPGHSELKIFRGNNSFEQEVEISINNAEYDQMILIEDIYWQASTRGGRPIDKILKNQVVFRKQHYEAGKKIGEISSNIMLAAPIFDNSGTMTAVGGAIGLIGTTNMAAAQMARPNADTRYWDNLPDKIHIYMAALNKNKNAIEIRVKDSKGNIVPELKKKIVAQKSKHPLSIVWLTTGKR